MKNLPNILFAAALIFFTWSVLQKPQKEQRKPGLDIFYDYESILRAKL